MNLNSYKGKLMMHTAKGVRRGEPADRVFAVVGTAEDQGRTYLLAWKCELLPGGNLSHPAYKRPLSSSDPRLFKPGPAANGATPTAMFRPDSLYRLAFTEIANVR